MGIDNNAPMQLCVSVRVSLNQFGGKQDGLSDSEPITFRQAIDGFRYAQPILRTYFRSIFVIVFLPPTSLTEKATLSPAQAGFWSPAAAPTGAVRR